MFKKDKDIDERNRIQLKSKDIKKLKQDLIKQFSRLTSNDFDSIFTNTLIVIQSKLENRNLIYYFDNVALFIDIHGRNNLLPTLNLLWKFPHCLRPIYIPGPVSEFILRGADLFLPGLSSYDGLETLIPGEKVSIMTTSNPMPLAVGMSATSYEAMLVNHFQGKAVDVIHYYNDKLPSNNYIPIGFTNKIILPVDTIDNNIRTTNDLTNQLTNDITTEISNDPITELTSDIATEITNDSTNEQTDNPITVSYNDQITNHLPNDSTNSAANEEYDRLVIRSILLALRYVVRDESLPLLASKFWTIVQKCYLVDPDRSTTTDSVLDIKKSSYKKVSQVLAHCMNDLHVLDFKQVHSNSEESADTIRSIHRSLPIYKQITLNDSKQFKLLVNNQLAANSSNNQANQLSNQSTDQFANQLTIQPKNKKIELIDLYKFPKHYIDIYLSNNPTTSRFKDTNNISIFTFNEVKQILTNYLSIHQLDDCIDRRNIRISSNSLLYKYILRLSNIDKIRKFDGKIDGKIDTKLNNNVDREAGRIDKQIDIYDDDNYIPNYSTNNSTNIVNGVILSTPSLSTPSIRSTDNHTDIQVKKVWKPITLPSYPTKQSSKKIDTKLDNKIDIKIDNKLDSTVVDTVDKLDDIVISKDDYIKGTVSQLTPYSAIVFPNGEYKVSYGKPPTIKLTYQKRAGNKQITSIRGIEHFVNDVDSLVRDFKKKFACSVSISPVKGIIKENEIIVQGSADVADILINQLGIPANGISITK